MMRLANANDELAPQVGRVTQQLARIPAEYLASCRQSAGESLDGNPHWDPSSADILDLDWAPTMLERICEVGGLDDVHLNALRQSTAGDTAIDLGFLNTHPHSIGPSGSAPTALSAAQVARVSELLWQIDFPALLAALPTGETEAASLIGDGADRIVGGLRKYLLGHFMPCESSTVTPPNGTFFSCCGGTDTGRPLQSAHVSTWGIAGSVGDLVMSQG